MYSGEGRAAAPFPIAPELFTQKEPKVLTSYRSRAMTLIADCKKKDTGAIHPERSQIRSVDHYPPGQLEASIDSMPRQPCPKYRLFPFLVEIGPGTGRPWLLPIE